SWWSLRESLTSLPVSSNVEGDEMSVTRNPGTAVSFTCDLTQNTNYIHVYKQPEGTAPQRLFYYDVYYSKFTWDSGVSPEKYRLSASRGKSYTFTMLYLEERDSGRYYCALWDKHVGSDFLSTALEILLVAAKNILVHRLNHPRLTSCTEFS
uniref:Ig-like domain-containing protein n=1 Tax=Catagonus wagneri TaxID=51154 RepID=A0A8C3YKI0_9CETA